MLTEIRNPRQISGESPRRWFHSTDMDLIVWFVNEKFGENTPPIAFQLCYDKTRAEKALYWKPALGFTHQSVDDGENDPGKHKGSPLLIPDGIFDPIAVQRRFAIEGKALPDAIRFFVDEKLSLAGASNPC